MRLFSDVTGLSMDGGVETCPAFYKVAEEGHGGGGRLSRRGEPEKMGGYSGEEDERKCFTWPFSTPLALDVRPFYRPQ